jgi:hypothetical protein
MFQATRITMISSAGAERVSTVFRAVQSHPGWIKRWALLAALIVIGVPIFLLVMLAVMAGVLVFGGLAAGNALANRIRGLMPRSDGRSNVRVIQRAEP